MSLEMPHCFKDFFVESAIHEHEYGTNQEPTPLCVG